MLEIEIILSYYNTTQEVYYRTRNNILEDRYNRKH